MRVADAWRGGAPAVAVCRPPIAAPEEEGSQVEQRAILSKI